MWVRIERHLTTGEGDNPYLKEFRVCPCIKTQHRPDSQGPRFVSFAEDASGVGPTWKWWALTEMEKVVPTKSAAMYGLAEQLGWDAGDIGTWDQHRDYAAEYIESLAVRHPLRLAYLKGSDEHRATDLALVELEKRTNSKAAAVRASRDSDSEMGRVDRFIERMQRRHGPIESDSEAAARRAETIALTKKKETK